MNLFFLSVYTPIFTVWGVLFLFILVIMARYVMVNTQLRRLKRILYGEDNPISAMERIVKKIEPLPGQGPRVIIYKGREIAAVVNLEYDETIIGRQSINSTPDIDMTSIDEDRNVSRQHAMIYKEDGNFYLRKLSASNALHVNTEPVIDEDVKLNDGDMIVLSRKYGLQFIAQ